MKPEHKTNKILILVIITGLLICMLFNIQAFAVDGNAVVYNGNQLDRFAGRTKEEIGEFYSSSKNAGESYISMEPDSYYFVQPSDSKPYEPGKLTDDTLLVMESMTNYFRWLVGVEPLTGSVTGSDELQAGALVRNWEFDHVVSGESKPADMPQELWDFGAAASHGILALGYTPDGAIRGWVNEGYCRSTNSWDTVGHRMSLTSHMVSQINYGYSGRVAIGGTTGVTNQFNSPFAAFPCPGYMPIQAINANTAVWDLQFNTDYLVNEDPADVVVSVTNMRTGDSYDCTAENGLLQGENNLYFVQPVPTDPNDIIHYAEGDKYGVRVSGLTDVRTGKSAEIEYTVEFFDVTPYTSSYVTGIYASSGWDNIHIEENDATTNILKMMTAVLSDSVLLQTETGRTAVAQLTGDWKLDEQRQCWTNYIDVSTVPDYVTDRLGILNEEVVITYQTDAYTGGIAMDPQLPAKDEKVDVRVWVYMLGYPDDHLYQVKEDGNGHYSVVNMYNNNSSEYTLADETLHYYTISNWSESCFGNWLAIYASPVFRDAYLAGVCSIDSLHEHEWNEWMVTMPPTFETAGEQRRFCAMCGKEEFQIIDMLPHPFVDVDQGKYYEDAVVWAVTNRVTNGIDSTHFAPNAVCNRGQVVTFLWRAAGEPESESENNPFADVKEDAFYFKAVLWAVENGITNGTSENTFSPTDYCTRGQVATFLWRTMNQPSISGIKNPFVDVDQGKYYYESVLWAAEANVTKGVDETHFAPNDSCTRGQIVTFLYRALR